MVTRNIAGDRVFPEGFQTGSRRRCIVDGDERPSRFRWFGWIELFDRNLLLRFSIGRLVGANCPGKGEVIRADTLRLGQDPLLEVVWPILAVCHENGNEPDGQAGDCRSRKRIGDEVLHRLGLSLCALAFIRRE